MTHTKWRPAVVAFADLMEARLREKDAERGGDSWKGGLYGLSQPGVLAKTVTHRASLLERAAFIAVTGPREGNRYAGPEVEQVRKLAPDVANFAMMVLDVMNELPTRPLDPWLPIDATATNGEMVWLLVDYRGEGEHPLSDAEFSATIGFWSGDDGDGEWKLAGWCWSHDHFNQGKGQVLAYKPIGFDLEAPACFSPLPDGANPPADSVGRALAGKAAA